jgi:hypothetical protein
VTARKEALRRGAANNMRKADVRLESGKYLWKHQVLYIVLRESD